MAELIPIPLERLVTSMLRSLERGKGAFDVPAKAFFRTPDGLDLSATLHGSRVATPFGPAAGPHAQMAQNMVMAWLVGARFLELKTVQIIDDLQIPRPCIDVPNLGYNVEWSQELRVQQSLEEYVKGSMLIDILVSQSTLSPETWLYGRPLIELAPGDADTLYDMSVGYDLAGIRGDKVAAFIAGMRNASAVVEGLRDAIPAEFAALRALPFRTAISGSVTLSTFHGCPPDEVERIGEHLIDLGLHTIIKLNPTLLGPERLRAILHDALGYTELKVPDAAFEEDMQPEQAVGILERLRARAAARGVGFGAKLTNTLVVDNHRDVFPASEARMYLSGPPLHALSATLAVDLRAHFGDSLTWSFSAGIDANNFHDALAIGLRPVTTCTDLLKKGGYSRAAKYFTRLAKVMAASGARTLDEHILATAGADLGTVRGHDADARRRALDDAARANGEAYRRRLLETDAYHQRRLEKEPKKPGTPLWTFDCLTCDICVPVCPNDANFIYTLDRAEVPVGKAVRVGGAWQVIEGDAVVTNKKHQIANFADLCNECGNCETFCPDLGGPYVLKPRFFGSLEQWRHWRDHDGFYVAEGAIWGRFEGVEVSARRDGGRWRYRHPDAELVVELHEGAVRAIEGDAAEGTIVDLTYLHLLDVMQRAILRLDDHILGVVGGAVAEG